MRCQEEVLPLLSKPCWRTGQARAVVATAFACFDAAVATWLEADGNGDILDLYDQGLAAVRA